MNDARKGESAGLMTRGDFFKAAAFAALGVAGLGSLAACGPGSTGTPQGSADVPNIQWDREVDVLVVGSGTAVAGALAAKNLSPESSVLLIEKSNLWGGTSGTSGCVVWVPLNYVMKADGIEDNRENALTYMKACSAGRCDESLLVSYLDNGNSFLEWTRDTFGWNWVYGGITGDYLQALPGSALEGRSLVVEQFKTALWAEAKTQAENLGVEIMLETAGSKLIADESGAVIGLIAVSGNKEVSIRASRGIILGTGGFDYNPQMLRGFQTVRPFVSNAVVTNTGDGQNMGAEIGASLAIMDRNWGLPSFLPEPFSAPFDKNRDLVYNMQIVDWVGCRGKPNALVVNSKGRRFGDEASMYPAFNRSFEAFDSYTNEHENIPAFFICDSEYTQYYKLPMQQEVGGPIPEMFVVADTIEELAQKLGIDPAGLKAEIETFNTHAAEGVDPVYHRGELSVEQKTSGDFSGRGLANNCLAPLLTPPFMGAYYVPGTCGTNGGLKVDANSQVLNTHDEPIPGLYAVGNCSAGVTGGGYCGAGMTVGEGTVMSYVAAKHMLAV
jgi:succinate dehydrogenase/fumarate reductase flavoprotein subunit